MLTTPVDAEGIYSILKRHNNVLSELHVMTNGNEKNSIDYYRSGIKVFLGIKAKF